jgi:hypothetical protein
MGRLRGALAGIAATPRRVGRARRAARAHRVGAEVQPAHALAWVAVRHVRSSSIRNRGSRNDRLPRWQCSTWNRRSVALSALRVPHLAPVPRTRNPSCGSTHETPPRLHACRKFTVLHCLRVVHSLSAQWMSCARGAGHRKGDIGLNRLCPKSAAAPRLWVSRFLRRRGEHHGSLMGGPWVTRVSAWEPARPMSALTLRRARFERLASASWPPPGRRPDRRRRLRPRTTMPYSRIGITT